MKTAKQQKKVRRTTRRKYNQLPNGATFHFINDKTVYTKICDAFSLNNNSGKEIIPHLFEKVVMTGFQSGYYPLWNA